MLREWYVVFITEAEGAACATLQVSLALYYVQLVCLVLVHVLLHVLKAWIPLIYLASVWV